MTTINRDEWLQALHDVDDTVEDPEALTVSQLAEIWGCKTRTTRDRAEKLVSLGRAVRVSIRGPYGRPILAYRLLKAGA